MTKSVEELIWYTEYKALAAQRQRDWKENHYRRRVLEDEDEQKGMSHGQR